MSDQTPPQHIGTPSLLRTLHAVLDALPHPLHTRAALELLHAEGPEEYTRRFNTWWKIAAELPTTEQVASFIRAEQETAARAEREGKLEDYLADFTDPETDPRFASVMAARAAMGEQEYDERQRQSNLQRRRTHHEHGVQLAELLEGWAAAQRRYLERDVEEIERLETTSS